VVVDLVHRVMTIGVTTFVRNLAQDVRMEAFIRSLLIRVEMVMEER
jgi:hypothetical protein